MPKIAPFAAITAALLLGGCATMGPGPIDVTRFHLGQPIGYGTLAVEPLSTNATISPEYQSYADAVATELGRIGFAPAGNNLPSTFIASVSFTRASQGYVRKRPPITIGVGGGSYGGGGGVGVGGSFGIGGGKAELIATELAVQLRRRTDGTVVWEGKARTDGLAGAPDNQPGATAQRLANAMFKGFPGESGITITVR